jgi:AraC-like DNA-binding protein
VPSPDTLSAAGYIYLGDELKDVSAQTTVTVANPARMGELQRFLDEIWGLTAHSPEAFAKKAVVRNLEQALVERLIAATALKEKSRATCDRIQVSRRSIIRKVDDYLRLLSSEPVYVSELCRAAGVSQPTLFRAFFDILGMGPKQYLQIRRLHLSRNRLLHDPEPGLTVHSVAYDLGFWHLGRFGTAYRELFGETPSQTLRRSHRMGFAR